MSKSLLIKFLFFLSAAILKKYRPRIVGITGSMGKTSAKDATALVLGAKFRVRASPKSYNNEIGIPLTIIGIDQSPGRSLFGWAAAVVQAIGLLLVKNRQYPELLVLEMGADKPGDIALLTKLAPCDTGVITSIAAAHLEGLKTLKKIIDEKKKIITHLSKNGHAVLNFDNEHIRELACDTKAQVHSFGFSLSDVQGSDARVLANSTTGWPEGINFKVNAAGHSVPVFLPGVIAEHLIPAALGALTVGNIYGVNLVEGAERLKGLQPCPGRMRVMAGIKNTLLIDDSYNSNPDAAAQAFSTLSKLPAGTGRRYAVLGDMLELGPETEDARRALGLRVGEFGIDYLITVGEATKHTAVAAEEAGLSHDQIASFADSASAGRFLQDKLEAGDVVLVKGSRGLHMEKVVREVMAEPEKAAEMLVTS